MRPTACVSIYSSASSDNRYNLVDIQHARDVLGYTPQDRAEDHLT